MTNKIFSKTVNKTTLFSVIIAVILAAAIVIGALFGFNQSATVKDGSTLTVTVNTFAYNNDKKAITSTCEKVFDEAGKSVKYVVDGEMDGDTCELVFVFDKKVDTSALKEGVKAALEENFKTASINVSASTEVTRANLAKHFVLRAAIAAAVLALLAFGYVAARYVNVWTGLAVGVSTLLAMLLTAGILVLTRIPVSVATSSVIVICGLLTAVCTLLTVGKARTLKKENAEESNEARILSALAVKETLWLCGGLAVAMLLVGILGKTTAAWYAAAALVSIAVAAFVSLFYAPALYLSLQKVTGDKKKTNYVGAKKKEKKENGSAEETAEEMPAQVEESTEETPAQAEQE